MALRDMCCMLVDGPDGLSQCNFGLCRPGAGRGRARTHAVRAGRSRSAVAVAAAIVFVGQPVVQSVNEVRAREAAFGLNQRCLG